MRRLGGIAALACVLALPAGAFAAGSVIGAVHAVVRAVAEEGGSTVYLGTPQVRCRHTLPSRFGCQFFNLSRRLGGRVSVVYAHGHYYVSEPAYERPEFLGSLPPPN